MTAWPPQTTMETSSSFLNFTYINIDYSDQSAKLPSTIINIVKKFLKTLFKVPHINYNSQLNNCFFSG